MTAGQPHTKLSVASGIRASHVGTSESRSASAVNAVVHVREAISCHDMANSSHPAKRSVSDAGGTVTPAGDALTDADYQRLAELRYGLRSFLHWSAEQAKHAGLTPTQHQLLLAIRASQEERGPS